MHSIRPRPRCRARNTFCLSDALWQHFVAPSQYLSQRPSKFLFTTEAAQGCDDVHINSDAHDSSVGLTKIRYTEFGNAKSDDGRVKRGLHRTGPEDGQSPQINPGFRGNNGQDTEKILSQAFKAYESAQDYEGVVVKPVAGKRLIKESRYPWVVPNAQNIRSAEERLSLEMRNFHNFMRPNQAEATARKHVIEQVRQHVQHFLPNYVLEVFGSERTGIAFAASDIDLRLIPENAKSDPTQSKLPPDPAERYRRIGDLKKLHGKLIRSCRSEYLLPTIRWARYPLISLQDRETGLDIQLVLSNDTSTSREYIQRYMQEYPFLPELYSVIKATLDIRGLSDVFRGGIGSYSLFMMIVASLKHKPRPDYDAATALHNFLRFWAKFKAEEHGISIEPPELFNKSEQAVMHKKATGRLKEGTRPPLPTWMFTLRDPADETNDLGRKTVAWKHVRVTLQSLLRIIRTDVAQNTRVSLLGALVGPIYAQQQSHRKKLAEYGRSLAQASRQHVSASPVVEESAEANAPEHAVSQRSQVLDELAAIARRIRNGETAN